MHPKYGIMCYGLNMPLSNNEAREKLQKLLVAEERDAAWVAARIGKSYLWVWRRLNGKTRIQVDDYPLILSAFNREPAQK